MKNQQVLCSSLGDFLSILQVVALGEIGLDITHKYPEDQKRTFANQLGIAMEFNLPLCIHVRNSGLYKKEVSSIACKIMKEKNVSANHPIHMHCFTDDWSYCKKWMQQFPGMKFGFCPNSFDKEVLNRFILPFYSFLYYHDI